MKKKSGKIGYGIIGCGRIFPNHAGSVKKLDGVELVAVADIVEERAKSRAEEYEVPHWYSNYNDLLARDDIDIVSICLPHHLHCEATVATAKAGKHVLCEKPIAINAQQADEMIAACEEANVKLGIVFQNRYNPSSQKLYKAFQMGRFGRFVMGLAMMKCYKTQDYYDKSLWHGKLDKEGGGTLTTQVIHTIDLLNWVMGPAIGVAGQLATLTHKAEVEDNAVATIRFKDGALGAIVSTNSSYIDWSTRLEIHGTKGSVIIEDNEIAYWEFAPPLDQNELGIDEREGEMFGARGWGKTHPLQIEDFVNCVREDKPFWIDGREGRKVSEILWGIYKSAQERKIVEIKLG